MTKTSNTKPMQDNLCPLVAMDIYTLTSRKKLPNVTCTQENVDEILANSFYRYILENLVAIGKSKIIISSEDITHIAAQEYNEETFTTNPVFSHLLEHTELGISAIEIKALKQLDISTKYMAVAILQRLKKLNQLDSANISITLQHDNLEELVSAIDDLEEHGNSNSHNIHNVMQHTNPKSLSTAISMKKEKLGLSQNLITSIYEHTDPTGIIDTLERLKDNELELSKRNIDLTLQHENPKLLKSSICELQYKKNQMNITQEEFELLAMSNNPMSALKIILARDKLSLTSPDFVKLIRNSNSPYMAEFLTTLNNKNIHLSSPELDKVIGLSTEELRTIAMIAPLITTELFSQLLSHNETTEITAGIKLLREYNQLTETSIRFACQNNAFSDCAKCLAYAYHSENLISLLDNHQNIRELSCALSILHSKNNATAFTTDAVIKHDNPVLVASDLNDVISQLRLCLQKNKAIKAADILTQKITCSPLCDIQAYGDGSSITEWLLVSALKLHTYAQEMTNQQSANCIKDAMDLFANTAGPLTKIEQLELPRGLHTIDHRLITSLFYAIDAFFVFCNNNRAMLTLDIHRNPKTDFFVIIKFSNNYKHNFLQPLKDHTMMLLNRIRSLSEDYRVSEPTLESKLSAQEYYYAEKFVNSAKGLKILNCQPNRSGKSAEIKILDTIVPIEKTKPLDTIKYWCDPDTLALCSAESASGPTSDAEIRYQNDDMIPNFTL